MIDAMFFFGNGHWNKEDDNETLPCEYYNGKRNDDTTCMDDDKNKPLETN